MYIRDPNSVITALADVLAPKGTRPSIGAVFTKQLDIFLSGFAGFRFRVETTFSTVKIMLSAARCPQMFPEYYKDKRFVGVQLTLYGNGLRASFIIHGRNLCWHIHPMCRP